MFSVFKDETISIPMRSYLLLRPGNYASRKHFLGNGKLDSVLECFASKLCTVLVGNGIRLKNIP